MFKKMMLAGVFLVLSAVLVLGAVNRTQARSALTSEGGHGAARQEAGQGGGRLALPTVTDQNHALGGSGQGQGQRAGQGPSQGAGQSQGQGAGQGGQGQGQGQGAGQGQGGGRGPGGGAGEPPTVHDWRTVTGSVTQLDDETMTVTQTDDSTALMEGRPWRYVLETGFAIRVGDQVTLRGFDEDGELKVGDLTNDTLGGASLQLRDADGRPAWRGQGNP